MSSTSTGEREGPVMDAAKTLGPELFIEEMMVLLSQSLTQMEVSDSYEIIRELGCGSFGTVQLVKHRLRGTMMALKMMEKSKTKMRCFLREYSLSLYLSTHPFITTAFGIAFESSDHYVFVQEYAPVGDLFDLIQPKVGIPEPAAQRCALQVAMALDHLHGRGLVHRDVKPENVLLFDRECRRVKLTDFGLARRAGLTVRHGPSAVPYLAPELCGEGARRDGARVSSTEDAWAFGVLLYSLLTGSFPWERTSSADPLYRAYALWRQDGSPDASRPPQWRGFTPAASLMLGGFLCPRPEARSAVAEVLRFLRQRWILRGSAPGPGAEPRWGGAAVPGRGGGGVGCDRP